jgi:hypothetical protein
MDAMVSRQGRRETALGLGLAGLGAAALAWLMRGPAPYLGQICGHAPGELHCPACYVAAAATLVGLITALVGAPRLAPAAVASRRRRPF